MSNCHVENTQNTDDLTSVLNEKGLQFVSNDCWLAQSRKLHRAEGGRVWVASSALGTNLVSFSDTWSPGNPFHF